jgi:hypothetical protein
MPSSTLPEITLRSGGMVPPMMLLAAVAVTMIPSWLPSAPVPAASVPI